MKLKQLKQLVYGATTFIPGLNQYLIMKTGSAASARYCYSAWLRHLAIAKQNGLNTHPKTIAELGPGDSLGIGLAALISGSENYYAFDVYEYANLETNLRAFDELVELLRNKADIPDESEFPRIKPDLDSYYFPEDILTDSRLKEALKPERLARIRDSILHPNTPESVISYKAPWFDPQVVERNSVDLVYSQAVLEHVDDLDGVYETMYSWLKPTGFISHDIDFKCHGTADEWNGHWTYSDLAWTIIKGRRNFLLNREPHSTHLKMLEKYGFKVLCDRPVTLESTLDRSNLARRYADMSDRDLTTSGAFIQAVKR